MENVLVTKADTGKRVLAFIIDAVLINVVQYIILTLSYRLAPLAYLISFGYLITKDALPIFEGQSIGKKIMNIKVIKDETGLSIKGDYMAGLMRALGQIVIVDYFYIFFAPEGKRFGDQWAKTTVVNA